MNNKKALKRFRYFSFKHYKNYKRNLLAMDELKIFKQSKEYNNLIKLIPCPASVGEISKHLGISVDATLKLIFSFEL